jgi:hypothetical protein
MTGQDGAFPGNGKQLGQPVPVRITGDVNGGAGTECARDIR